MVSSSASRLMSSHTSPSTSPLRSPSARTRAGVFVLRATLACLGNSVEPRLNIPNLEQIESFGSDARDDVDADQGFISCVSEGSQVSVSPPR
jgi:hypothetical protein